MRWKPVIAGLALIGAAVVGRTWWATDDLDRVHALIATEHAGVEHISPDAFAALDPTATLVFDVREPDEFAVSHLPGAVRIDPGLSTEDFEARFGDALAGKQAVFYCSVGRRSSIAAERYADVLEARGVRSANLARGIFGWVNEERQLVSASGPTDVVHPYDAVWGRLVEDEAAIRYTPVPN